MTFTQSLPDVQQQSLLGYAIELVECLIGKIKIDERVPAISILDDERRKMLVDLIKTNIQDCRSDLRHLEVVSFAFLAAVPTALFAYLTATKDASSFSKTLLPAGLAVAGTCWWLIGGHVKRRSRARMREKELLEEEWFKVIGDLNAVRLRARMLNVKHRSLGLTVSLLIGSLGKVTVFVALLAFLSKLRV